MTGGWNFRDRSKVENAKESEKGKKTNNVRPSLKCKFYERGTVKMEKSVNPDTQISNV